jgi:hypothetical protein
MFGLFSRKPAPVPEAHPTANGQERQQQRQQQHHHRIQQLRTPSPSVASIGNPNNSPTFSTTARVRATSARERVEGEEKPPITPSPPPTADPTDLYNLLSSIPPKILHEYVLDRLNPSQPHLHPHHPSPSISPSHTTTTTTHLSPLTLTLLTSFFSALTPPPLLHCARCHKSFYDVENDDRSCTVGHDDESAEVERVRKVGGLRGVGGAGYETLWGCCGKTVEGDGDMGPPDGWCYEGKHTVNPNPQTFLLFY